MIRISSLRTVWSHGWRAFSSSLGAWSCALLLLISAARAQSVHETFDDDPLGAGRFVAQTAGTESLFTYDPAGRQLSALLDVDFDTATYLSTELPAMTDRQNLSFSVRFQVTAADESGGFSPSAVIGLVTTRHVDNFGDGLTLALTVRNGKLFAGGNIDSAGFPKRSSTNILLAIGQPYLAYARYGADSRSLRLDLFGGTNYATHVGSVVTDPLPPDLSFSVDRIGLQNAGAKQVDATQGSITVLVDDLFTPGVAPVNLFIGDVTVAESAGTAVFPVRLPLPAADPISVDYQTESGTAIEGADFEGVSGTLVIPAGSSLASISVPIKADGIAETNETFTVRLSNPHGANIATGVGTGTILDSDPVTIFGQPASFLEGNSGNTLAAVILTLSNPSVLPVTLQYHTVDGTALAGSDYLGTNGVLVFPPGTRQAAINLLIKGDNISEGNELFFVELAQPVNASLATNRVPVEIRDDDPLPLISVSDATFTEGDFGPQPRAFVATLSSPSSAPISFRYSTRDGTAVAGQDYTAISQVVTVPAGQVVAALPVTLLGDLIPEDDETFQIVLSSPVNALLANTVAQATILDDDRIPQINVDAAQVKEGNSGDTPMEFHIWLSKVARDPVEVDYFTASRPASATSATAGIDYRSTQGHLQFRPGETNLVVTVPVIGDLLAEETEFFDLQLSSPLNAEIGVGQAQGAIIDDDGVTLQVNGPAPVLEGDGFDVQAVFTITLAGVPTRPVTVFYATRDGSALAGLDYRAASATVTFQIGETTKTVSVGVIGDLEDEPDETFDLGISNASGATITVNRATAVIKDNDPPQMRIEDLPNIPEGGTNATLARFWVTLSSASQDEIQVDYATEDGTATAGADYAARSGRLVFAPGATQLPIDITILPDSINELDETFFINLRNPVNVRFGRNRAMGTIKDDDPPPVITIDDVTVGECTDGASVATATLHLSAPAEHPVTVQFATRPGTATAGSDYISTNGVVVFPAGSTEQKVSVQLVCDNKDEPAEGFGIDLSGPDGGSIGGGGGGSGQVTIIDDDPPEITVLDATVLEGNVGLTNAAFQVQLSSALDQEIDVNYFTVPGTATPGVDYAHVSGTLVFPPGVTSTNINVPIINDTIPEGNETFQLFLTNAVNAKLVVAQATGTILDDDIPELQAPDVTVVEGDQGLTAAQISLTLTRSLPQPVTVAYRTRAITASANVDYVETNGVVTFAAGEVSQQLTLEVIGDTLIESPETFALTFFNPVNVSLPRAEAIVTIADDDGTPVLSAADVSINEGDPGQKQLVTFVLKLSRASQQAVTVQVQTVDGTATNPSDYVRLLPKTIQFPPNVLTQRVSVTVNGDAIYEGDEDFYLVLSNPANATLASTQVRAVIRDDDAPPSVRVDDVSVVEGNSGTTNALFPVSLSAPASQAVTFSYSTVAGSAKAGSDYLAVSGVMTLAPGVTKTNIAVPVLGDREVELDESFTLQLADISGAVLDRGAATGTIINDDGIALLVDDASLLEPDQGETPMHFLFHLAKPVAAVVTVQYQTVPGTATAEVDYRSAAGTVTFPPGITNQAVDVFIKGDLEDEPDETFRLILSAPVNASLVRSEAIGTIIDNDPPRVSIDDVSVNASLSATQAVFTVSLSNPSTDSVSVRFTTANGTATAGTDFIQVTNTLAFRPGETQRRISIPVLVNTQDEGNEVFFLRLFAPINATAGKMQGLAEILNEERANVPPRVQIVSPGDGAVFPVQAPISVAVSASDPDGQVSEVLLLEDGVFLARFTAPPYSLVRSNEAPGVHVFQASATDDKGAVTQSEPVTITVQALPALTFGSLIVEEGDSGSKPAPLALQLSRPSRQPVTVEYDFSSGTATLGVDFTGTPGSVVFAPGETNKTIIATVLGDRLYEGDEVFHVLIKAVNGASAATTDIVGTILDDDPAPIVSIDNPSVVEGDSGTRDMVFTVTFDGDTSLPASVQYQTENGTALAGLDYNARSGTLFFGGAAAAPLHALQAPSLRISLAAQSLTVEWDATGNSFRLEEADQVAAGAWRASATQGVLSGGRWSAQLSPSARARFYRLAPDVSAAHRQEIRVPVIGDTLVEPAENFFVRLYAPVNLAVATPRGEGVIVDDDQPSLAVDDVRVTEGDSGLTPAPFVVKLSTASPRPVSVYFATKDGTALAGSDYVAQTGAIVFNPGETEKTVSVPVIGDLIHEADETFSLQLSLATNAILARPVAIGLIVDDDGSPELSVRGASVVEGNSGTTEVQAALILSRPSSLPVSVSYRTEDLTAVSPGDYEAASGQVTFAPGETTRLIPLRVQGDLVDEPNESFLLRGTIGDAVAPNGPSGEIVILNDDAAPVLAISDTEVLEGDIGSTLARFTVTLTGQSSLPVTVSVATQDGTATAGLDYLAGAATLTFAPGETTHSFEVAVLGDFIKEPDEYFSALLSQPLNAALGRSAARCTIRDDDVPPPAISPADISLKEGDSGLAEVQVRVTLSAPSKQAVSVSYQTTDGSAQSGLDYQASSGVLSFAPGETAKAIKLLVVGDTTPELDETFTVAFSNPASATLARPQAVITILDDDNPTISAADVDLLEGTGGTTDAVIPVRLSAPNVRPTSVSFVTTPGTASADVDYQSLAGTVNFAPGETTKNIIVKVIADALPESTEEFYVDFSGPVAGLLATPRATVRIRDDDGQRQPPAVALTYPADQDVFPAGADITVTAAVQQGTAPVTKVELFVDGQLLGSLPFASIVSFPWASPPVGSHLLKAAATDSAGLRTESASIQVTIQADDGKQRVAIVQNFADPEISRLQGWLADMDLSSRVFNQEGLTLEMLADYDLIIWDDLGVVVNGLTANDVAIFKQLHDQQKPLYFIGTQLVASANNLPVNLRPLWTELTGLQAGKGTAGTRFAPTEDRHPVVSGGFGLVGEFGVPALENVNATLLGNNVAATAGAADLVVVSDDFARIVSQDLLPTQGAGLNRAIQREKLFKNSVSWLLRLSFPPFLNLTLDSTQPPSVIQAGASFDLTFTIQHSGEQPADGIILTVTLPPGLSYVRSNLPVDKCIFDDGAILCFLGGLSQTDSVQATITLRADRATNAAIVANVSANQAEAVVDDNTVELFPAGN